MPFYQYYGFTQVFIMLDVGLHLQDHPPPRNGGMAMAIPMTTLEDGLQDEARKNDKYNPHWILVYCNIAILSNKQHSLQKKTHALNLGYFLYWENENK